MLVFPIFVSVKLISISFVSSELQQIKPLFAVAQAFMEHVPQGVRVIVRLFLKAGVKSKGNSGVHRTSVVGGWRDKAHLSSQTEI